MALNVKNPRTLDLIDELAQLTGQSKADAIRSAVEARLQELRSARAEASASGATAADRLEALIADTSGRFARSGLGALPDESYPDPIADLYDDAGLPR